MKTIASNRRARFDYEIVEEYEAGMALEGSEVKSLRAGSVSLNDAYAMIRDREVWLVGLHISPYSFSRDGGHDPTRDRKLLLHRREIDKLTTALAERGLTLIPLRLYFKDGRAKVSLGLGRGKDRFDKRRKLKEKQLQREMDREVRHRNR